MKQKYLAAALSFCLLFNFCTPLTTNAETMDETIVSADDGIECIEKVIDETVEESFTDEQEITGTNSDETVYDQNEVSVLSVEEIDNEAVIDFSDGSSISDTQSVNNQDDQVTVFGEEANENIDSEGYRRVTDWKGATTYDIGWKFDESTCTLSFKVWDGCESAVMPDQAKASSTSSWAYSGIGGLTKAQIQSIKKIVIGEGITRIGNNTFKHTTPTMLFDSLEEVVLPSSLKEIGNFAFQGTIITKIDCKNVESMGISVFQNCSNLTRVSFNQSDLSFANETPFNLADKLRSICFGGNSEQWNAIAEKIEVPSIAVVHCRADKPEAKEPTCEDKGLELSSAVCEMCGATYSIGTVKEALGHEIADTYTVDKSATCTETGEQSKHCTREGCEHREDIQTIPVDSENHDWTSKVTTEPTCTKEGVLTYTCSRCNETKTEPIKATGIHQWSNWKTTKKATVFEAEQQTRTCSSCNKTETKTVGTALKAKASVNASTVKLKVKQSTSGLKVTGLANGDSVKKWKSSNTKVFTVSGKADGTCKLTAKKKGTAKLEITMASGLKKTVTVKVQPDTVATTKISGLTSKLTIKKGSKTTLKPIITPFTSTQKVTYSSSNKKVASVSSKGVVTAKKAGTAKITVKSGSKKVVVTVTVPKTKTTDITVVSKATVKKGKTYSLKATVAPGNSDQAVTYTSSNKKVATVTKTGTIKGVKKGTATITVKSGSVTKKVKVTVR